ncbi:MAG: hypothetical protein FWF86_07045 [Clostridia bacterium]|nr:hypothetical protein [Clostridia bacterium]
MQMTNAVQKNRYRSWLLVCLLGICACMPLKAGADDHTYEGPGWDTPEDAVTYYLEGMKEQDIGKMIGAYAVETYIDHFNFGAQLARIGVYSMSEVPRMPNAGNLLRSINIEARKHEIAQSILLQLSSICLPWLDFSAPISLWSESGEKANAFVEELESAFGAVNLHTLVVMGFVPPEMISKHYGSEANRNNMLAQYAPAGADDARSVVAAFVFDDKVGILCCDAIRYEDRWFMSKAQGNIGLLLNFSQLTGGMVAFPKDDVVNIIGDALGADVQEIVDEFLSGLLE